jgi:hypothetical protein
VHNDAMGQWLVRWRTWNPRLLWLGAVDIAGTVSLILFLLSGHHQVALKVWAVLVWLAFVPAVTIPELARMRRQRRSATRQVGPSDGAHAGQIS